MRYILLLLAVLLTLSGCSAPQEQATTTSPNVTSSVITETAREKAFNHVSSAFGISKEKLIVYEQDSIVLDQLLKEEVEIFVIGDKQSVLAKLVVDSTGQVMDVQDYQKDAEECYKAIAGNINSGLYNYLQSKEPDYLVKVKIFTRINNEVVSFIESIGFKITSIGDLPAGRIVYAELPKVIILDLAKRTDVADMEQDLPYVLS